MNWKTLLIIAVVAAILIFLKMAGQISAKDARECLENEAMVIDVRSPGEYASDHLASAVNIPLDEIETAVPLRVKDKDQTLLLHCQSGMRSSAAAKKLKALGYTNVHNLGSYARAKEIVGGSAD